MKHELPKIEVHTLPNGYALNVDNKRYLYFNAEDLIAGFFTHVAVGKTEYLDKETVEGILIAAATWKTIGDAMEANANLIAEARKAHTGENAALRGQAAANERAEKAEREVRRLKERNIELESELFQLKASMDRISKTIIGKPKSRPVVIEEPKMTKGRQHITSGKKQDKSRYARKG